MQTFTVRKPTLLRSQLRSQRLLPRLLQRQLRHRQQLLPAARLFPALRLRLP